jgi:hypothetical protein
VVVGPGNRGGPRGKDGPRGMLGRFVFFFFLFKSFLTHLFNTF